MSKRILSLFLVVCVIFGMIPAFASAAEPAVVSEDEDTIHIDFKDTVRQMSEQDWYDDLTTVQTADGYEAKRIGSKINTPGMSETELNAYAAMRDWLGETQIWNINEQRGGFINLRATACISATMKMWPGV